MRDLKRIEDNLLILDHEMRPNVTIGLAEFFGRHKRHDHTPHRVSEPVGLDDDDEWDHPTVSAGISVNTQLIRH
jgi:hypothetical protein